MRHHYYMKKKVMFDNKPGRTTNHDRQVNVRYSERRRKLGQTISANPAYERKKKKRIEMEWSAFGKYADITMDSNLPRS